MVPLTFQRALRHFPFPQAGSMGSLPHFTVERTRCGECTGPSQGSRACPRPQVPCLPSGPVASHIRHMAERPRFSPWTAISSPTHQSNGSHAACFVCHGAHANSQVPQRSPPAPRTASFQSEEVIRRPRPLSTRPGPSKPLPSRLITIRGRGRECQQHQQTATVEDHTDTRWRPHRHQLLTCQG